MNRRSSALITNPLPTGAVCACTSGTNSGPPAVGSVITAARATAHRFAVRERRQLNNVEPFIDSSALQTELPPRAGRHVERCLRRVWSSLSLSVATLATSDDSEHKTADRAALRPPLAHASYGPASR